MVKRKLPERPPKPKKGCPVSVAFTEAGEPKLLRCGQWNCPYCARLLARRWAVTIKYHIEVDRKIRRGIQWLNRRDYWFITLTLRGEIRRAETGFTILPDLWDRLRKAFRRKYAFWRYLAFVEGQPQRGGMPHFHIISDVPLPIWPNKHGRITKRMVHDFAWRYGWGFEAEQSTVSTAEAGSYVAKYASKQHPATPHGFRRVRASGNIVKPEKPPRDRWIVKGRGEGLGDFLSRASEAIGLSEAELHTRFTECWKRNADILPDMPFKY